MWGRGGEERMRRLRIEAGENPRRHEPVASEGWPPSVDGDEEIHRFPYPPPPDPKTSVCRTPKRGV